MAITQITVVEPQFTNAVRSHDHPILEPGNPSFPLGRYWLDFEAGEDRTSFRITHRTQHAGLIGNLVKTGSVRFACIVSAPSSGYRKIHVSDSPQHDVAWKDAELAEPPLFTPLIVCRRHQSVSLSAASHDVHQIWDKRTIMLRPGSRLAVGNVFQLQTSVFHLIHLKTNDEAPKGHVEVDVDTEPFRFRVKVDRDMHKFLRFRRDAIERHNTLTHIVTACLARLQRDFADDDGEMGWKSHSALRSLADQLSQKKLGHWSDSGFRPEKVATELTPLVVPSEPTTEVDGAASA